MTASRTRGDDSRPEPSTIVWSARRWLFGVAGAPVCFFVVVFAGPGLVDADPEVSEWWRWNMLFGIVGFAPGIVLALAGALILSARPTAGRVVAWVGLALLVAVAGLLIASNVAGGFVQEDCYPARDCGWLPDLTRAQALTFLSPFAAFIVACAFAAYAVSRPIRR